MKALRHMRPKVVTYECKKVIQVIGSGQKFDLAEEQEIISSFTHNGYLWVIVKKE